MKYKFQDLIGLSIALGRLKNKELPPRYIVDLFYILDKIKPALNSFEEMKKKLIEQKKQNEIEKLLNETIEIDEIKIKKEIINKLDKIDLETYSLLEKFIEKE